MHTHDAQSELEADKAHMAKTAGKAATAEAPATPAVVIKESSAAPWSVLDGDSFVIIYSLLQFLRCQRVSRLYASITTISACQRLRSRWLPPGASLTAQYMTCVRP